MVGGCFLECSGKWESLEGRVRALGGAAGPSVSFLEVIVLVLPCAVGPGGERESQGLKPHAEGGLGVRAEARTYLRGRGNSKRRSGFLASLGMTDHTSRLRAKREQRK